MKTHTNPYRSQLNAGLSVWTKELNQKQASLMSEISRLNPKISISASGLSKAKHGNDSISEGKLIQIVKVMDEILQMQGFAYDADTQQYLLKDAEKAKQNPLPDNKVILPLSNLAGVYEAYHLSTRKINILKNILHIYPNGELKMWGIENNVYQGEAEIFQSSLLAMRFHQANDYPFFIQILCKIGSYSKLGSGLLKHFFGICSSISIDNAPIAYKRIFIKIGEIQDSSHSISKPENIFIDSNAYLQLNTRYPQLGEFLQANSILSSQHEVNDEFHLT